MIKKFTILLISILPLYVLNKLENLFSISQGKGFSDPEREAKVVINFLKKKIINNIFDIGSHKGHYVDHFKKKFNNIHLFLFEPDKKNYLFLKKNTKAKII